MSKGSGKSGPRRYTAEFRRDAVALYRSSGRPVSEVARQLGVNHTSLGNWIRAADAEGVEGGEAEAEAAAETVALRKRIRELETEIDILKRFTAYWVGGSDK